MDSHILLFVCNGTFFPSTSQTMRIPSFSKRKVARDSLLEDPDARREKRLTTAVVVDPAAEFILSFSLTVLVSNRTSEEESLAERIR